MINSKKFKVISFLHLCVFNCPQSTITITFIPNQQVADEQAEGVTEFLTWVSYIPGAHTYPLDTSMSSSTGRGRGMAIWGRVYGGGSDQPSVIMSSNSTPQVNHFML